jgi:serine/threonine protein kinase
VLRVQSNAISATHGELLDRVAREGAFTERMAASIVKQVLSALITLHDNGIAHRDLKA